MKNRPFVAARTVLAVAAIAALSATPIDALALGLGRLNVQSALGEGLRAEIDITSLSAEEAATLQVRIAPPEAYRAAGVDYNAVLAGAQATLARRADGRPYLRVTSDRAVQEPFIEVILELNSSSGRLAREFTLLFDPPGSRMAPPVQAAAPVAPAIAAAPAAPGPAIAAPQAAAPSAARAAPRTAAPAPAVAAAAPPPPPAPARPRPAPAPRPAAAPAPAEPPSMAAVPGERRYQVRPGDTLYRVAGRTQPQGVSLDQMLVGLYRANPEAFIDNNVNRLRAGSVLSVPTGDEVRDVSAADARRLLTAQSADFSAYRARLAQAAPLAQPQETGRAAQGKVQASVEDRKQSAAPSPDKLTLSGGAIKASAPDTAGAQPAERKDSATRVAELTRNVEELKKLQQGAAAAQASAPPAQPAPIPAPASAPAATAAAPAPAPMVAPPAPPAPPAPAIAPKPAVAMPSPAPASPVAEPGLLASLTDSPWLLPGAGALALLLAGFGAWRLRGRMKQSDSETSFLESRMQPDSFFGASGGQRVDTREAPNSHASSMGYSLSQLDAIGDVDPVAEADVYLAYGRDLQAEEILKEAMRATPDRLAVRTKLLEVYAKRRDTKGFELLATQLYALTKGVGSDWAHAQELGRQCDPDNQLYQPGGHPEEIILDGERVVVEPLGATTLPQSVMAPSTQPPEDSRLPEIGGGAVDLDLDLSLDALTPSAQAMEATRPLASGLQRPTDPGLEFDFEERTQPGRRPPPPLPRTVPGELAPDSLRMDLDALDGDTVRTAADTRAGGDTRPGGDSMLDFPEFGTSEPGTPSDIEPTTPSHFDPTDPLARKLELADEFRQIGDLEGARDLLEEVVAKATGALQVKAQAMLDALG
ncbi:MAG: LysM peptidoglycan-binding domain-containing protein [Burkholderiaceae bacterium]|nr:LysM peptidoglycan-binding domain-containing protein [Burkholderiaceae bacterium]